MATKTPPKKGATIKKQEFDLTSFKTNSGLQSNVKDKDLEWIPLGEAFSDITKCGIAKGYVTLLRGYSNTGKSTGMYEGIASCQKLGILPVIIDTEGNFNWEYARNVGVEFNEVTNDNGEIINYDGFFIFMNTDLIEQKYGKYKHDEGKYGTTSRGEGCIEDISMFINELLDQQIEEKLPYELCFFWDSIGSIDCYKAIMSKSRNNMWNANALEVSFKSILNNRIPNSRKEGKKYTNTFVGVQKIWYDGMNNVVRHKGGEAFFYGARMIFHYGGIIAHGTSKLTATLEGRNYNFGTETKLGCIKNQVNGLTLEGKICSTPHGYWLPDKVDQYKKQNKDFLLKKLGFDSGEISIKKEEISTVDDMFSED
jgi:hypothetical protein